MASKAKQRKSASLIIDFGFLDWLKLIAFAIFGMFSVATIVYGYSSTREGLDVEAKAQQLVENLCKKLEKEDPDAAKAIREKSKSGQAKGLAAALLFKDKERQVAGLKEIADSLLKNGSPGLVQFFEECLDKDIVKGQRARQEFIESQGALLAMANTREVVEDPELAKRLVEDHVARIRRAMADQNYWEKVKNDPLAILILDEIDDLKIREIYLREREWLAPVLATFRITPDVEKTIMSGELNKENPGKVPSSKNWEELIQVADKYAPLPKNLVTKEDLGAPGYGLFLTQGDLIKNLTAKNIPLREVAEVIYANADFFAEEMQASQIENYFLDLYRNKKPVWDAAKSYLGVLRLDKSLPELSTRLLDNYASIDVATFLMINCSTFLKPAAESILKFKEIAIFSISKYKDQDAFVEAMKMQGGFRVPAFMITPGKDEEKLKAVKRPAAINAVFDEKGDPVEAGFWESLPLAGGPAKLVNNWLNNRESSWSDYGWALMDAGDTALLVATFGAAAPKAGASAAAKSVAKSGAKKLAQEAAEKTIKIAVTVEEQIALKAASRTSMLGRIKNIVEKGSDALSPLYKAGKVILATGKWVLTSTYFMVEKTLSVGQMVWKGLPKILQTSIKLTILVLTIGYGLVNRTLPMLEKAIKALPAFIKDTLAKMVRDFTEWAKEVACEIYVQTANWQVWIRTSALFIISSGLAYLAFPFRRRRVAF